MKTDDLLRKLNYCKTLETKYTVEDSEISALSINFLLSKLFTILIKADTLRSATKALNMLFFKHHFCVHIIFFYLNSSKFILCISVVFITVYSVNAISNFRLLHF